MKVCSKCGIEKENSDFFKYRPRKDGLSNVCKLCSNIASKKWRDKNGFDGYVVSLKRCSKCDQVKDSSHFWKSKSVKDGLSKNCKDCTKLYVLQHRDKVLASQRSRNKKVAESEKPNVTGRICSKCHQYKTSDCFWKSKYSKDGLYSCCIECKKILESVPARKLNRNKCIKTWVTNNLEKARRNCNEWDKQKRKADIGYRLRRNTMHAIIASVRNYSFNSKLERLKGHIFDHLPYTSEELKSYIESLWEPWMNWDNYGRFNNSKMTWQIDHIIPQSKLPFESFEHENFQKLWALENLRPLETISNIKKGNKPIVSGAIDVQSC